ncbi:MAG: hypothetical protein DRP08_08240 [Candidatus Aenigmatarchaeota archaeon]|nr:MAG: hypothetical protein DRP08_08240 [Candidatus Aenigmarchaeota archaeon]
MRRRVVRRRRSSGRRSTNVSGGFLRKHLGKRGESSTDRKIRKVASIVTWDERYIEIYRHSNKYFYKRPFKSDRLRPLKKEELKLLQTWKKDGLIIITAGKLPKPR